MPVISISIDRFNKLLDKKVTSVRELADKLPWIGLDIEDAGTNYIKIEYTPNRPDLGTPVGIARVYEGLFNDKIGLIEYTVFSDNYVINVNPSVHNIRPFIVSCVVKDVNMDEDTLIEIINLQEDLHQGLGRGRRKVSIGIHNLDVINFPISYTTVDEKFSFIPLNTNYPMSIESMLENHPIASKYKQLVSEFDRYPILIDAKGNVLSFPPIINSEYTRVYENTKNLFIDVTATDLERALNVLNILATTLADYGGKIYEVKIFYEKDNKDMITPDLRPYKFKVNSSELINMTKRYLGLDLSINDIVVSLLKCRFGVSLDETSDEITIHIPKYRVDILHLIDIVEEIAIGYGYWKIKPEYPQRYSVGEIHILSRIIDKIVQIMISLGFIEVINYILTNPIDQTQKMFVDKEMIMVEASKTTEHSALRFWIIPQLLKNLYISKDELFPQKIFEVGEVFEDGIQEDIHLAAAISHSKAGYSEIRSILDAVINRIKINMKIEATRHPSFINGRVGTIIFKDQKIGIIGEIHPKILRNFGLEMPVSVFEVSLTKLFG